MERAVFFCALVRCRDGGVAACESGRPYRDMGTCHSVGTEGANGPTDGNRDLDPSCPGHVIWAVTSVT